MGINLGYIYKHPPEQGADVCIYIHQSKNWFVPIMIGGSDMANETRRRSDPRENKRTDKDEINLFMKSSGKKSMESMRSREESSGIGRYNEEGFWDYITGLFEGDGSIWGKEGRKPGFQITFNKEDLPLAKELLRLIGGGRINLTKGPKACDLIISRDENLKKIAMELNGRMRTPKIWRLYKLIDWLNNKKGVNIERKPVKRGGMGKDSWLSGLIDADGSFGLINTNKKECTGD